jgi:hypothetical protein
MLQDVLRLGKNERDISRLAIIVKADHRSAVSRCPGAKIRDSEDQPVCLAVFFILTKQSHSQSGKIISRSQVGDDTRIKNARVVRFVRVRG